MSQFNRCQFGTCQSDGIDRTIAFISKANKRVTVRPILCDKHHRAAMEVDGAEWAWLQTLRVDMN
jgi:hypothetical protein